MKLAEGAVLLAGIATFIGSTALAFLSVKADATAVSAIKRLKAKADDIEALASANFNMSLEKLEQQLIESWVFRHRRMDCSEDADGLGRLHQREVQVKPQGAAENAQ